MIFYSLRWQRQLNICHWCDVWITILLFTNDFVSFAHARYLFECFNLKSARFQCFCIGYCAIACSQAFADTSILCSFTVFVQQYRLVGYFVTVLTFHTHTNFDLTVHLAGLFDELNWNDFHRLFSIKNWNFFMFFFCCCMKHVSFVRLLKCYACKLEWNFLWNLFLVKNWTKNTSAAI